ncbi:MAG: hypothetical protein ACLRSW_06455 [Christensenellaceae bacterium]
MTSFLGDDAALNCVGVRKSEARQIFDYFTHDRGIGARRQHRQTRIDRVCSQNSVSADRRGYVCLRAFRGQS